MRTNVIQPRPPIFTHEGAPARHITPEQQLRRLALSTLLWEKTFYQTGESIADAIRAILPQVPAETVARLAIDARTRFKLRHIPLLLVRELARLPSHKHVVAATLPEVIQRPDELGEYLSLYWGKENPTPISWQSKRGLAAAWRKFGAYAMVKWDREAKVRLRDIAFLMHVKPRNPAQGKLTAQLVNKTFYPEKTKAAGFPVKETYGLGDYERPPIPDTWEVILSGSTQDGLTKKQAWEKVIDIWITDEQA